MNVMPCIAGASTTEEPGAEKLHAGVCAGGGARKGGSYRT